jgi:rhodanese-related sulfurtransferase
MRGKVIVNAILRELPRIAAIGLGSLVLAIAANAGHTMQLPLLTTGQPGIPDWVRSRFRQADAQAALRLVQNPRVLVVDTRDAQDFRQEHIHGAISLPYHGFSEHYRQFTSSVPKERPLLLYCYGSDCGLASRVGKRLITEGYTEVTILRNGIVAWKAANLPLEASEEDNGT